MPRTDASEYKENITMASAMFTTPMDAVATWIGLSGFAQPRTRACIDPE